MCIKNILVFRCVQDRSSQNRELIPPWLEDLHATFRPVAKTVTQSTTTVKISDYSDDNEAEAEGETNDDGVTRAVIIDTPRPSPNTSKAPPNSQGRYFLIQNGEGESKVEDDDDDDGSLTTLIISVSISIVSTLLSVIIIVHICRKVKSKSVNAGARGTDNLGSN